MNSEKDYSSIVGPAAGGTYERPAPILNAEDPLIEDPRYPEWLNLAVADGSRVYKDDDQVPMIDDLGKAYLVPGSEVKGALVTGAMRVLSPKEAEGFRIKEQMSGAEGAALSFAASALDPLTFGVSDTVMDHTMNSRQKLALQIAKEEHQGAAAAGWAGGFLGSLAYGGPLFKAAASAGRAAEGAAGLANASNILTKTLGAGVRLGAEGAALSAPKATAEALFGDPQEAAEIIGFSMGVGALIGAGGNLVKVAGRNVLGSSPGEAVSNWLGRKANQQSYKSVNISSNQRLTAKVQDSVLTNEEEVGKRLLDDKLQRGVREEWTDYAKRLAKEERLAGKDIGKLYKDLDLYGHQKFSKMDLADQFRKEVYLPLKTQGVGQEAEERAVLRYIKSFERKAKNDLGFEDLHSLRVKLDQLIFKNKVPGSRLHPIKEELNNIRSIMTKALEKEGEAAAYNVGDEFVSKLREANKRFVEIKFAREGAKESAKRSISNRGNSITDYIMGAGSIGSALLSGNPSHLLGGYVAAQANKFGREHGNMIASQVLRNLSKGIKTANQHLAGTGQILDALSSRSTQAGTQFLMSDISKILMTDPEKSRTEQLKEFGDRLDRFIVDPDHTSSVLGKMRGDLKEAGLDYLVDDATLQLLKTAQYLQQELPRPKMQKDAFDQVRATIPDAKILAYLKKVDAAMNPFILNRLPTSTLGREQVATVNALYPKLSEKINSAINYESTKKKRNIADSHKGPLSMILGTPVADFVNVQRISAIQGLYAAEAREDSYKAAAAKNLAPDPTDVSRLSAG